MSIAVMRHGALVWLDTFGFADVAARTPVTRNTQFRIGSVSKLLTAFTAARLVESGKLDLDASVRSTLSELPASYAAVTTRELLGHLGGVHHYGRSDYFNRTHFPSVRASVAKFMNDTLIAPPGTKSFYSSYGFVVIGAEIEAITRSPFTTAVATLTTGPLGLDHTVVEGYAPSTSNFAQKYQLDSANAPVDAPPIDLSDRLPAGGFLSTARDVAAFGSAVIEGRLLTPAMRTAMLTPQSTSAGTPTIFGFGWRLRKDAVGRRIAFHGGDAVGGRAFLLAYPDDGLVLAMTSNLGLAQFAEKEAMLVAETFLSPRH
jgi:CubicO group peptidase (beta-lactamase class C family)